MHRLQIVWQLVLADFRERTRRYSYLITLIVSLYLGYLVLTGKYAFRFGTFQPAYNSHWIGTIMALAGAAMFSLFGFYIVRSSISRDRETRVGEILATTLLSNTTYLFAKFVSNILVLWSMVTALLMIACLGMLTSMPFAEVNFIAFITPFIFLPYTLTIAVAAAAVLFDTATWLQGIFGNIMYFFYAEFMIVSGILKIPFLDGAGMGLFEVSIRNTISSIYPGEKIPMAIGFINVFENKTVEVGSKLFVWNGIDWSMPLVLSRLIWPSIGMVMLLISILLFDRFEKSKKVLKIKKKIKTNFENSKPLQSFDKNLSYKKIPTIKYNPRILNSIIAELTLSFKQLKPIWYLIGIAIVITEMFVPFEISRKYIIPAAMIWPLILWSSISTREEQFNMRSLTFSSAGVHTRQFIAMLLSGIAISIALCFPMLVRSAVLGENSYLFLLIATAFLLPCLAFAFGVVSGSKKLFEVLYLFVWYGGSIDQIKAIDLLGTTEESTSSMRITIFLILALSSAIVAYLARRKNAVI